MSPLLNHGFHTGDRVWMRLHHNIGSVVTLLKSGELCVRWDAPIGKKNYTIISCQNLISARGLLK